MQKWSVVGCSLILSKQLDSGYRMHLYAANPEDYQANLKVKNLN